MENIHQQLLASVLHIEELITCVVAKQAACPLLCQSVSLQAHASGPVRVDGLLIIEEDMIDPTRWVMLKGVWDDLGMCRSTFYERKAVDKFKRYCQKKDAHLKKPRVWLLRAEVEAYRRDNPLK